MERTCFEKQLNAHELRQAVALWLDLKASDEPIWSTWYKDGYADVENVTFSKALAVLNEIQSEGYEGYLYPSVKQDLTTP